MYRRRVVGNHNSFGGASLEELYPFCVPVVPRQLDDQEMKEGKGDTVILHGGENCELLHQLVGKEVIRPHGKNIEV
jgi:hypothetical protein